MSSRMTCYEFGRELLRMNDLDPVYVVVWESRPDWLLGAKLSKWLMAYWCFYHAGTASWICDQDDFWLAMFAAADSKDYPRSTERRHFRGKAALDSVVDLRTRGIKVLDQFFGREMTVADCMRRVREWVGFGPWIAFKVADMLERLGICLVEFDAGAMFLFDSPRKGAEMLWKTERVGYALPFGGTGPWAVNRILAELGSELAPPRYERTLNVQEAETILCKWHSYMNGHYELGEDVKALRRSLLRFARTPTAQKLLRAGGKGGLW